MAEIEDEASAEKENRPRFLLPAAFRHFLLLRPKIFCFFENLATNLSVDKYSNGQQILSLTFSRIKIDQLTVVIRPHVIMLLLLSKHLLLEVTVTKFRYVVMKLVTTLTKSGHTLPGTSSALAADN